MKFALTFLVSAALVGMAIPRPSDTDAADYNNADYNNADNDIAGYENADKDNTDSDNADVTEDAGSDSTSSEGLLTNKAKVRLELDDVGVNLLDGLVDFNGNKSDIGLSLLGKKVIGTQLDEDENFTVQAGDSEVPVPIIGKILKPLTNILSSKSES